MILCKASESECCRSRSFKAKEPLQKQRSAFPTSSSDGSILKELGPLFASLSLHYKPLSQQNLSNPRKCLCCHLSTCCRDSREEEFCLIHITCWYPNRGLLIHPPLRVITVSFVHNAGACSQCSKMSMGCHEAELLPGCRQKPG